MQLNTATGKTDGERKNSTIRPLPEPLKLRFTIMQERTWQSLTFSSRNPTPKGFAKPKKCPELVILLLPGVYLDSAWVSVLLAWQRLPIIASFALSCCSAKRGHSSRKHKLRRRAGNVVATLLLIIHQWLIINPAILQVTNFGLVFLIHLKKGILNQRPFSYWS